MKPEKQRIAIAEACGWILVDDKRTGMAPGTSGEDYRDNGNESIPDYLNDLNAMHAAEEALKPERPHAAPWLHYRLEILKLCGDALLHAGATQRAEAFLRTLNLWTDK
jgi:hypothetical protein